MPHPFTFDNLEFKASMDAPDDLDFRLELDADPLHRDPGVFRIEHDTNPFSYEPERGFRLEVEADPFVAEMDDVLIAQTVGTDDFGLF